MKNEFESLVAEVKSSVPSLVGIIEVNMTRLGFCRKFQNGKFIIEIKSKLEDHIKIAVLLHEWHHAMSPTQEYIQQEASAHIFVLKECLRRGYEESFKVYKRGLGEAVKSGDAREVEAARQALFSLDSNSFP